VFFVMQSVAGCCLDSAALAVWVRRNTSEMYMREHVFADVTGASQCTGKHTCRVVYRGCKLGLCRRRDSVISLAHTGGKCRLEMLVVTRMSLFCGTMRVYVTWLVAVRCLVWGGANSGKCRAGLGTFVVGFFCKLWPGEFWWRGGRQQGGWG
jgi:hypothetical protein